MKTAIKTASLLSVAVLLAVEVPSAMGAISPPDPVTIRLTSAGGNIMGGVYVNPYTALIDGVSTKVICDDFIDDTYVNEVWTAQYYDIANDDLSTTRMAQNSGLSSDQTALAASYKTAAYLAIQLMAESDATKRGQISFALWSSFDNSSWSSGALSALTNVQRAGAEGYLAAAKTAVAGMTLSQFSNVAIYSPVSVVGCPDAAHPCPTSPPQELLVVRASEASALASFAVELSGIIALFLVIRRYRRSVI